VATTHKLPIKLYERLGDEAMTELLTLFADLGAEIRAISGQLQELNGRLEQRFATLEKQIAGVLAELIKWTFLFWLGTIGVVLLLLRFPR
jgi:hypothetical protein